MSMGGGLEIGVCLWLGAGSGQRNRARSGASRGVRDKGRDEEKEEEVDEKEYYVF
jgi:hypothetical protein